MNVLIKKEAVEYLQKVFEISLESNLEPLRNDISSDLLASFGRVFLEDSTGISLNEKLADEFCGSGGSASKSALKIGLIYEMKQNKIYNIKVSSGTVPDQTRSELILKHLETKKFFQTIETGMNCYKIFGKVLKSIEY